MSGTPSISETYAVYGNRRGPVSSRFDLDVSLVVLARSPWMFRPQVLEEFHALGFPEILLVEDGRPRYDAEELLRAVPELRILIPLQAASPGVKVNQAAREVRGDKFLVVWDDQSVPESALHSRVQTLWKESASVALAPERRDREGRDLPSVMVPGLEKDRLKILALGADLESVDTLFPADFTALYDRHRFLHTGGFDPDLGSPFWQKVDWGLRSRLWGERLTVERPFKLDYRSATPIEDQSVDRSYSRFFLRNLAVRHAGDHGVLPFARFWTHAHRTGLSLSESLSDFLRERNWVHINRYRFQTDARLLAEQWGNP
jgi:hypothetical protein